MTNNLTYERRYLLLEYTQRGRTSIKAVSKPTPIFMSPCETLELGSFFYAVKTLCAVWLRSWGFLEPGESLKPWAAPVALSEIYFTIFLSSHILYVTRALRRDEFVIGVILCKMIWGIGPQTTFLCVAHLFTLLPIKYTSCGAQFNCVPHIPPWGVGYWHL